MTDKQPMACQRLVAGYTTNGNKRALWAVYGHGGQLLKVIEEYYSKPEECKGLTTLPEVQVPINEYRDWMAAGRRLEKKGV